MSGKIVIADGHGNEIDGGAYWERGRVKGDYRYSRFSLAFADGGAPASRPEPVSWRLLCHFDLDLVGQVVRVLHGFVERMAECTEAADGLVSLRWPADAVARLGRDRDVVQRLRFGGSGPRRARRCGSVAGRACPP
jgi:hypothetical protein